MSWVLVGTNLLNVDQIEYAQRVSEQPFKMIAYMNSGKVIEITETTGIALWKFLDSERLKFLDLENPERDFSGT